MARKKRDDLKINELGKTSPHETELEKEVLGAILIDPESIGKAIELLPEQAFYRDAHRKIYQGMIALYEKNEPVDVNTLSQELIKRKEFKGRNDEQPGKSWLELAGGVAYLAELSVSVPSAANLSAHLKIIRDLYIYRHTIASCNEIATMAYQREYDASELLDHAEAEFFKISQHSISDGYKRINPLIHEVMEEVEKIHHRKTDIDGVIGVPSGLKGLDSIMAGFQPSDLIIIAGRPAMGKTAFALNVIRNVTAKYNIPAAFFSLEMGANQLVTRLISAESRIKMQKIRTGKMTENEFVMLAQKLDGLSQAPLYIDDTPGLNVLTLRSRARRLKKEANIKMIIVDYLQLMEGPRAESRQIEITMISRALKILAKELDIPVVALSQLSRAVESRTDKKPQLSDLRESGAIEQDADVV
ncbi:MAG: replicative DNA helicase, partial [Calditrichia bacterium]|nr:replicative DNA helicase [Calditrichia bacterium]